MEGTFPVICIKPDDDSINNAGGVSQASADECHQGHCQDDAANVLVNPNITAEDRQLVTNSYGCLVADCTASQPTTHQHIVKIEPATKDLDVGNEVYSDRNINPPGTFTWIPQAKNEHDAPTQWIAQPSMVTEDKDEMLPQNMDNVKCEISEQTDEAIGPKQSKYIDAIHEDTIGYFAKSCNQSNVQTGKIGLRLECKTQMLGAENESSGEESHSVCAAVEDDDSGTDTYQEQPTMYSDVDVVDTEQEQMITGVITRARSIKLSNVRSSTEEYSDDTEQSMEPRSSHDHTYASTQVYRYASSYRRSNETENMRLWNSSQQNEHTKKTKVPKCCVCKKRFKSRTNLQIHMRVHTEVKPYKCLVCEKYFAQKDTLTEHMRRHSGEKRYKCSVCGKSYSRKSSLTEHARRSLHIGDKPYSCTVCGKSFATSNSLTLHSRTHTGEKPYQCSVCGKLFASSSCLGKHSRIHTGEKPYQCTVCDKSFAEKSRLTNHTRLHSGDKPYSCTVCGKSFVAKCRLTSHTRQHSGDKPYSCTVCGKSFVAKCRLTSHTRQHTGDKPYSCTVCGKSFAYRSILTLHSRTHTGEKPYQCAVCGKAFAYLSAFSYHRQVHSGEKPYKCPVCGKSYSRKINLTKHTCRGLHIAAISHNNVKCVLNQFHATVKK